MEKYKPSGKLGPALVPIALVGGLVLALAGAWIYQWSLRLIPFIYVNCVVTVGFGYAIGIALLSLFRHFKGRNTKVAIGLAVLIAVVGWGASFYVGYGQWLTDVDEQLAENDIPRELVEDELGFMDFIEDRVDSGWTIGAVSSGLELTGVFVYIIWIIEFGLIVGAAVFGAHAVADQPFCETCDAWMPSETIAYLENLDLDAAKAAAKRSSLEDLFEVPPATGQAASAVLEAHRCGGVDCPQWLTARVVWIGKKEDKGARVCRHRRVSHAEIDDIVAVAEERSAPPSAD